MANLRKFPKKIIKENENEKEKGLKFNNHKENQQKEILILPMKHTTLFRRFDNVVDVQTTLYQRQNDAVSLLGRYTIQKCYNTVNFENSKRDFQISKQKWLLKLYCISKQFNEGPSRII